MRLGGRLLVVAVGALALAAGFAAGYLVHGTPSAGGPPAGSNVLSITAAGTLSSIFPSFANTLANRTAGVQAPLSAQQYEGSSLALNAIAQLHQRYDVAASADFHLIPKLLEPTWAGWEVIFATTPEVLAFDPSVSSFQGINTTNWADRIRGSGILLGVANASTDPAGYNGIFVLELQGLVENGSNSSVYGHFYSTAAGTLAVPNPSTTRVIQETQAATLLGAHQVAAVLIYRSFAIQHHLSFVTLDSRVNLGGLNDTELASYSRASTTVLSATGAQKISGGPVAFAATVPTNAPNSTLGFAFVHLLLSPEGTAALGAGGFNPVFPGWSDRPSSVPSLLAPDVQAMPSQLLPTPP